MKSLMGFLWIGAMLAYVLVLLAAAFAGFDQIMPWWLSFIVFALCIVFRFHAPLIIAAFFGAWLGFEWHFLLALLLAMPGLAFVIPVLAASLLGDLGEKMRAKRLLR